MVNQDTKTYVNQRVDRIYDLIEGLKTGMEGRMAGLENRMDGLYSRMDGLSEGLNAKMDAVLSSVSIFTRAYERTQEMYTRMLEEFAYIKEKLNKGRMGFVEKEKQE